MHWTHRPHCAKVPGRIRDHEVARVIRRHRPGRRHRKSCRRIPRNRPLLQRPRASRDPHRRTLEIVRQHAQRAVADRRRRLDPHRHFRLQLPSPVEIGVIVIAVRRTRQLRRRARIRVGAGHRHIRRDPQKLAWIRPTINSKPRRARRKAQPRQRHLVRIRAAWNLGAHDERQSAFRAACIERRNGVIQNSAPGDRASGWRNLRTKAQQRYRRAACRRNRRRHE